MNRDTESKRAESGHPQWLFSGAPRPPAPQRLLALSFSLTGRLRFRPQRAAAGLKARHKSCPRSAARVHHDGE